MAGYIYLYIIVSYLDMKRQPRVTWYLLNREDTQTYTDKWNGVSNLIRSYIIHISITKENVFQKLRQNSFLQKNKF